MSTSASFAALPSSATDDDLSSANRLSDTGIACLIMMARLHGVAADPDQLAHEFKSDRKPFTVVDILHAAKKLGLIARCISPAPDRLSTTPLPAIAGDREGRFFIVAQYDKDKVLIHDPQRERPELLSHASWQARWSGELVLLTSRASLAGELVVAFDGYEPKAGDRWTIVLAGRLDGDFRAVHAPTLPEGLRLEAVPMGATFEVRVVAIEE